MVLEDAVGYYEKPFSYGARNKDEYILNQSSSGGVFTALAEFFLESGGIVIGAIVNDNNEVEHAIAKTVDDLGRMRGSKYVQSNKKDIFRAIKVALLEGKKVLFTGTPCECAGVLSFVEKIAMDRRSNLYLCDFICHGVPSPSVFKKYIGFLEKKDGKIELYKFRCKDKGWKQSGLQMGIYYETDNNVKRRVSPAFNDPYMCGFLEDIYLRPSCYNCKFKVIPKRTSDITIGDFWGLDKINRTFNDGRGASCILVHNQHGMDLFNYIKEKIVFFESEAEAIMKANSPLIESAYEPRLRASFMDDFISKDYSYVQKTYMNKTRWFMHTLSHKVRKYKSVIQFLKFCAVGVSNTTIAYIINVCSLLALAKLQFRYDYIIANTLTFILSVLWSYYWNGRIVFSESKHSNKIKLNSLIKTYITYGFSGIILKNLLSFVWVDLLGISKFIAPLINVPITMPFNFIISKFWAFGEKNDKKYL